MMNHQLQGLGKLGGSLGHHCLQAQQQQPLLLLPPLLPMHLL
jgi:hypothetical protein